MADKRLGVKVPEELHRAVKAAAASLGETLQFAVVDALQKWLDEK